MSEHSPAADEDFAFGQTGRSIAVLAAIVLIILSGCATGGPSPEELPAKPENVTEATAEAFAKDHEVTLKRNQLIDRNEPDTINVFVTSATVSADRTDGYVVILEVEYNTRKGNNAGDGWYVAGYFVNETVVLRDVQLSGNKSELDPLNGTRSEALNP
jgi:hypothetical protein